jgi:hypothetical protein
VLAGAVGAEPLAGAATEVAGIVIAGAWHAVTHKSKGKAELNRRSIGNQPTPMGDSEVFT